MSNEFKLIAFNTEKFQNVQLECPECQTQFWIDPTTEENLVAPHLNDMLLVPECPNCAELDHTFFERVHASRT